MGRFLSVDPTIEVAKALYEPQRWNRYAYVHNNPLNLLDPNGKQAAPGQSYVTGQGWTTISPTDPSIRETYYNHPEWAWQYAGITASLLPIPGEQYLARGLGAAGRFFGLGSGLARGSVLLETAIARGAIREGGALGKILSGIEAGFKAGAPKSAEKALELVAKSAEATGKEPGTLVKATDGARYVLQNVGDVKTLIYKTCEVIVKKGDELLVRYIPK